METWNPIDGSRGLYSASDAGRIRSEPVGGTVGRKRGRVLTPHANRKGYLWFRICFLDGAEKQTYVHAAVASAFLGPRPDGKQVNHKNGIKTDNRPENLEYVSCEENIRHCWASGLHSADHCTGEKNNHAKLGEDDIRSIRALASEFSGVDLAKKFGVTPANISSILKRKTWRHVA